MCLLAACCVVPAVGQDWKEALKSAASNVVDKATGGKATETLMIGDSRNDAEAARGAGCPVVLLSYGYNHGEPVREVPADGWFDRIDDLAQPLGLPG